MPRGVAVRKSATLGEMAPLERALAKSVGALRTPQAAALDETPKAPEDWNQMDEYPQARLVPVVPTLDLGDYRHDKKW